MKTLTLLLLSFSLQAATVLRLSCGGPGGTDAAGNLWTPDYVYVVGGTLFNVGSGSVPYRALRWTASTMTHSIPLPNGAYAVTLKFLEPRTASSSPAGGIGLRTFDVSLQGLVVLPALDVFAAVGGMVAKDYTFPATVTDGKLRIVTTALKGNAMISGVQVDSVDVQPVTQRNACEVPFGIPSSQFGNNMFTGVYGPDLACWNLEATPAQVTSLRCASDALGTVVDVMLPDAAGALHSVLPAPMVCNVPPEEVVPVVLTGVAIPPGQFLSIFYRISAQAEGSGLPTASAVVVVAGLQR